MNTGQLEALQQLNSGSAERFVQVIGPVFEHSPWIAEAALTKRPFKSVEQLATVLCDVVRGAGLERQLALIRAHPDLVGKAAQAGSLTAASTVEQAEAGLNRLSVEEVETFRRFNAAYHEKFGFPFVICARLNKKEAILSAFPIRLTHDRQTEIATALAEIYKIAYFRLQDIVAP